MLVWLQLGQRDFCWAAEGDVLPLVDHLEDLRVRCACACRHGHLKRVICGAAALLSVLGIQNQTLVALDCLRLGLSHAKPTGRSPIWGSR